LVARKIFSARKGRIAYSANHVVPRSWTFMIDQVFYSSPKVIIKDGEIWWS